MQNPASPHEHWPASAAPPNGASHRVSHRRPPAGGRTREDARLARRAGARLKLTHEREGKSLRQRAAGYAHAKQFNRLKKMLRHQRKILGGLLRVVRRKMVGVAESTRDALEPWLQSAERLPTQRVRDKNKLYAQHAPEVECISKGKTRGPYEFGVKVRAAVTHRHGLTVGARSFPGNPCNGHTLAAQIEQTIEPAIGHLKADHRMNRCRLKGSEGDALLAVLWRPASTSAA